MEDKLITPVVPKKEHLKAVYDVFNKICKDENLFYSKEEVKKLKKDMSNKWL